MTQAFLPELPGLMIEDQVRAALLEDLGRAGDITSNATIGADRLAEARMNSREAGVIAGLPLAEAAFRLINPAISFEALVEDGATGRTGHDDCPHLRTGPGGGGGGGGGVLSAERVALNYLMHLSGIATHTARFADAHRPHFGPGHLHPQDPSGGFALSRNTPCAAAAALRTATGSTTRS